MNLPPHARESIEVRLAEVLAHHFDPATGTPYWIDRAARLGFDPRCEIRRIEDLPRMGFMEADKLRRRPLTDLISRASLADRGDLDVVQTGGTLGAPVWTAYSRREYEEAFVAPFVAAADHVRFPRGGSWLYIGPSGPHVIGRAAQSIARATGAMDPFTVDFDSRWARKLPETSFAARRYLEHVLDQAMSVLETQPITHLFATPPVVAGLADRLTVAQRDRIRGVHYGGLCLSPDLLRRFQRELFPNAVHLSGYGNTLFGCCLELDASAGRELRYYPHGSRLLFGTCRDASDPGTVDYGSTNIRGRCVFSRLDRTMLIINMLERDLIELAPPPSHAPADFRANGVVAPAPLPDEARPLAAGLY